MSDRTETAPTIASEAAGRGAKLAWELALPLLLVAIYQVWASAAGNPYFPTIPEIAAAFR